MITFWLAALAVTSANVTYQSGLVPEDHEHIWVGLHNWSGSVSFFDKAYRGSAEIGEKAYPVALVRYVRPSEESVSKVSDFRFAIDCSGAALAGLEAELWSAPDPQTGIRIAKTEELAGDFKPIPPGGEDRIAPLFKHICGEDWSIKPSN